jgi:hypothetical protein
VGISAAGTSVVVSIQIMRNFSGKFRLNSIIYGH